MTKADLKLIRKILREELETWVGSYATIEPKKRPGSIKFWGGYCHEDTITDRYAKRHITRARKALAAVEREAGL